MTVAGYLQGALFFVAAIAALFAAHFWRVAAKEPPAMYAPAAYSIGEAELAPANEKIKRGAKFNEKAANWTAGSAIAQGIALLVPLIAPVWEFVSRLWR